MTLQGTIVVDLLGLALVAVILNFVRGQKLYVGFAVIWLLSIGGLMVLVSFPPLLSGLTRAVGALVPVSALSLLAFVFIFLVLIYLSVHLTIMNARLADVARFVATRELESRSPGGAPRLPGNRI